MALDSVLRNVRSAGANRDTWKDQARRSAWEAYDAAAVEEPPAWTRQQADAWRRTHLSPSPWRVVAAQASAGLACAAIVALLVPERAAVASSLWGAGCAVVPSALLARGMTRGARHPLAAAAGFMFWEMLKIGVAIAMLAVACKVVANLNWPALLVTMVVCIKVNWLALLGRGSGRNRPAGKA